MSEIEEHLIFLFGEPDIKNNIQYYFCGLWIPASFDVIWMPEKEFGYIWDFKFKNKNDFDIFTKKFFEVKKDAIHSPRPSNLTIMHVMKLELAKFSIEYCDYTEEEIKEIKDYYRPLKEI